MPPGNAIAVDMEDVDEQKESGDSSPDKASLNSQESTSTANDWHLKGQVKVVHVAPDSPIPPS